MGITNTGRGLIRDAVDDLLVNGGVGLSNNPFSSSDTGLFGGGTTVDSLDSSTGWSSSGSASDFVQNTTSDDYLEGSACVNAPTSSGTGSWSKTISSTDLSSKKAYLWFYIDSMIELTDSSTAVSVGLSDSSTFNSSNTNYYYTGRSELSNGWNNIKIDVDNPSIEGSSLVTSTITDIKVSVEADIAQSSNNMRFDYLRYYEPDTLGISDSVKNLNKEIGNYYVKTVHLIATTESNGLTIVEAGDNNGSDLISRTTFASLEKGNNTELQVDKYYYIESS